MKKIKEVRPTKKQPIAINNGINPKLNNLRIYTKANKVEAPKNKTIIGIQLVANAIK